MNHSGRSRNIWRWILALIAAGCVLFLILGGSSGILRLLLTNAASSGKVGIVEAAYATSDAASVGIIGGADGPTAILVASPAPWPAVETGLAVLILALSLLGFWRLSPKKKQDGEGNL